MCTQPLVRYSECPHLAKPKDKRVQCAHMAALGTNWFCADPTPSAEIIGDYAEFIVGKCERCQEGTPMDVDKREQKRKDRSPTPPDDAGKGKGKEKEKGKERESGKRRKGVSGVAGKGKGKGRKVRR